IEAGQQAGSGIEPGGVTEYSESAIRRAEELNHRTHLRVARRIPHVAGYSTGLLDRRSRQTEAQYDRPNFELAQFQHHPTPWGGIAGSYSTANTADGSIVCLEILSFTLISIL